MYKETDDSGYNEKMLNLVYGVIVVAVLTAAFYAWLSEYGRLIGAVGSVVLALATFAGYQWAKVLIHSRWPELSAAEDETTDPEAPITLNLSSSGSRRSEAGDE